MHFAGGGGLFLVNGLREENIRRIIDLEDRISACRRCPEQLHCVRRPAMGKGDLNPDIMVVFESETQYTIDLEKVIELRTLLKSSFGVERIYHTYMMRCAPKACSTRHSVCCYTQSKLLDKDYHCILTEQPCNGLAVKPDTSQIINCLAYLVEEIDILAPRYVFLMGERVSEFVLKCYGIFDSFSPGQFFFSNQHHFIVAPNELSFNQEDLRTMASAFSS